MESSLDKIKTDIEKKTVLHGIFDRVEKYAHSKYKMHALFWFSFFEQSISPIPPDILIIPISIYKKYKALYVAAFASFAGMLGGLAVYIAAYYYGDNLISYFNLESFLESTKVSYADNVFWTMLIAAFTPIPDRIFTVLGGAFKVSLLPMLAALLLGKFVRYYIVAYIAENYGEKARDLILAKVNKLFIYATIIIIILVISYKLV